MTVVRLTAAQAMARYLTSQFTSENDLYFAGIWAIFGHGNVAGLGEALYETRAELPVLRGHNEQGMAHAAIAYAKAQNRQRAMVVTTSIGPGATNMITAAALAHVNRLPVLLIPGDVFATRAPDPVLQQVENFQDGTVSANDCFKPVSRYFDRITRPEQLLTALPRAMRCLLDPSECGPVTLAFCQDVQAEAYDWPVHFFEKKIWSQRRARPDVEELHRVVDILRKAERPLLIAGGGIHYSQACETLRQFVDKHQIPVAETQAGKSALPGDHLLNMGSIGVTGSASANLLATDADVVLAVGTRLQDFTTGSWSLFKCPDMDLISVNVAAYDGVKHQAHPLIADASVALTEISNLLADHCYTLPDPEIKQKWRAQVAAVTDVADETQQKRPSDAQLIGAVQRSVAQNTIIVGGCGWITGRIT